MYTMPHHKHILILITCIQELHKLLSRRLSHSYQTADDLIDQEKASKYTENLVYTDHTKRDRTIYTSETDYRNNRQTIFCSATIPQRKHFVQTCYKVCVLVCYIYAVYVLVVFRFY